MWRDRRGEVVPLDWLPLYSDGSSADGLARLEHSRRALDGKFDAGTSVPIDLFLWRREADSQGPVTRVGGVPFRDASKPWPVDRMGEERPFLAQLSFVDSRDIFKRALPGDVLCIYAECPDGTINDPESEVAFEWVSAESGADASPDEGPSEGRVPERLEGEVIRYTSYPEMSYQRSKACGDSSYGRVYRPIGTLIGTATTTAQDHELGDSLIAVLASYFPPDRWPYLNVEEDKAASGDFPFGVGDDGGLYFVHDPETGVTDYDWDCG